MVLLCSPLPDLDSIYTVVYLSSLLPDLEAVECVAFDFEDLLDWNSSCKLDSKDQNVVRSGFLSDKVFIEVRSHCT